MGPDKIHLILIFFKKENPREKLDDFLATLEDLQSLLHWKEMPLAIREP